MYEYDAPGILELSAKLITLNENTVFKGAMPWRNELLQNRIDRAILDSNFIESFNITIGVDHCKGADKEVMNQLLGRILIQDIHRDGFKEITLS